MHGGTITSPPRVTPVWLRNGSVLPGENPRSAGFQPAVSRISNPQALENSWVSERSSGLPNGIRRYRTARSSRKPISRSVWSAWSLLPLSAAPRRSESASKLDALQTLRDVRGGQEKSPPPATISTDTDRLGSLRYKLPP